MYDGLNLRCLTPASEVEVLNRGSSVSHRYSFLDEPDRAVTTVRRGDVVRVTVTVVAPADGLLDPRLNIVSDSLKR